MTARQVERNSFLNEIVSIENSSGEGLLASGNDALLVLFVGYIGSCKGHTLLACSMVCNRSSHLPGNLKQVWHPACLIKEGGCVNLSVDTMHLKSLSPLWI